MRGNRARSSTKRISRTHPALASRLARSQGPRWPFSSLTFSDRSSPDMRPARFLPGTKSPSTPSDYTDAQYKALDKLKQTTPALLYGAARPEFANKVLLADGSVSDDLNAVRQACAAAEADNREQLRQFMAANTK